MYVSFVKKNNRYLLQISYLCNITCTRIYVGSTYYCHV